MPNVSVTNKGEEEFAARFDGQAYTFAPGKPVVIPQRAAAFLFAYGMTDLDRARVLVRNGWQANGDPDDELGPVAAMNRLRAFIFKAAPDDPPGAKPQAIVLGPAKVTSRSAPASPQSPA